MDHYFEIWNFFHIRFYLLLQYIVLFVTGVNFGKEISSSLSGIDDLYYFIQLLLVRHQFKIAFFNELRQDPHSAIK